MSFESSLTWIEPSLLCFGERPGRPDDLDLLRRCGIGAILSLMDEEDAAALYEQNGFVAGRVRLVDRRPPSQQQISECLSVIEKWLDGGMAVYFHCMGGLGRSGSIAAAWLIRHHGTPAVQAIDTIRRLRPGAIETDAQYNALLEFAAVQRRSCC